MSGSVRIGIAVLIGGGIILSALLVRSESLAREAALQGLVVSVAPEREYIPPKDNDGDGVEDWKEPFTVPGFEPIEATETGTDTEAVGPTYTPPTTFTDRFSEAFFSDYISGKVSDGSVNAEALVTNGVAAVENAARVRVYGKTNVILSTTVSAREYGNAVGAAILAQNMEKSEPEYDILKRALDAQDPSILEALTPIRNAYANTLRITLQTSTPLELAAEHLALVNAYSALHADIVAMQMVFEDPLYALARFKQYEEDATNLHRAFKLLDEGLRDAGATFGDNEAGALIQTLAL